MNMPLTKILVIEDDPDDYNLLHAEFHNQRSYGKYMFHLECVDSVDAGLQRLRVDDWNFFIVDYQLKGCGTGLDFVRKARNAQVEVPAILLSGNEQVMLDPLMIEMMSSDRIRFLAKDDLNWECLYEGIADLLTQSVRILVVEDDPDDVEIMQEYLQDKGYVHFDIEVARSVEEAAAAIARTDFHAVTIDYHLGPARGTELFDVFREHHRDPLIVLCTGHDDLIMDSKALQLVGQGRCRFVSKQQMNREVLLKTLMGTSRLAIWNDGLVGRHRPLAIN